VLEKAERASSQWRIVPCAAWGLQFITKAIAKSSLDEDVSPLFIRDQLIFARPVLPLRSPGLRRRPG